MELKYTPMINQYLKIKNKYPDTLILFRLGDFYELFFDDAKIASKELQLALTGKSAGVEEKVPMCGVPHHAINSYIDKLIDYVPDLLDKSGDLIKGMKDKNKCIEKLKEKIEENIKDEKSSENLSE